jgi:hypothetical protein
MMPHAASAPRAARTPREGAWVCDPLRSRRASPREEGEAPARRSGARSPSIGAASPERADAAASSALVLIFGSDSACASDKCEARAEARRPRRNTAGGRKTTARQPAQKPPERRVFPVHTDEHLSEARGARWFYFPTPNPNLLRNAARRRTLGASASASLLARLSPWRPRSPPPPRPPRAGRSPSTSSRTSSDPGATSGRRTSRRRSARWRKPHPRGRPPTWSSRRRGAPSS